MGTTQSIDTRRPVNGSIQVQLQKTGYIGGEIIFGILNLHLLEPFPGHILQVSLEGIEETHFTYTVSSGSGKHRRTKTVYAKGLNKFLDFAIPVFDFAPGDMSTFQLNPGQWQIPFQIAITPTLPSSLNFQESSYTRCNLIYRAVGTLIPTLSGIMPLQGMQNVFIAQQMDIQKTDEFQVRDVSPQICCCCSKGKLNLKVMSDKVSYAPGEKISIIYQGDATNYGSKVNALKISLTGSLVMKANQTQRTSTHQIEVAQLTMPVSEKQFRGSAELVLTPNLSLTCVGDFIRLEYNLKVQTILDSCCCVMDDDIVIPIRINPTPTNIGMIQMPQMMQMNAPAEWNPTVLQPTVFTRQQTQVFQQQQNKMKQYEHQMYTQFIDENNAGTVPIMVKDVQLNLNQGQQMNNPLL